MYGHICPNCKSTLNPEFDDWRGRIIIRRAESKTSRKRREKKREEEAVEKSEAGITWISEKEFLIDNI